MKPRTPRGVMVESNRLQEPQQRRSPRFSSPLLQPAGRKSDPKMAPGSVPLKRSITLRKIAPRKTVAPPPELDKENTPGRAATPREKKQKESTPGSVPKRGASGKQEEAVKERRQQQASVLSPILPGSPPPASVSVPPPPPSEESDGSEWPRKVRRSYSRLSERSLLSPDPKDVLFGFEKLQTPEVAPKAEPCRSRLEGSSSALNSFTSLLEAEECGAEPDFNIPGVAVVKEKRRRRRKVPQIDSSELDLLAAQMNAEFMKAEEFELVVE